MAMMVPANSRARFGGGIDRFHAFIQMSIDVFHHDKLASSTTRPMPEHESQ